MTTNQHGEPVRHLPLHVRLPLFGNPCLICGYPAHYVDERGRVHHDDGTARACRVASEVTA